MTGGKKTGKTPTDTGFKTNTAKDHTSGNDARTGCTWHLRTDDQAPGRHARHPLHHTHAHRIPADNHRTT